MSCNDAKLDELMKTARKTNCDSVLLALTVGKLLCESLSHAGPFSCSRVKSLENGKYPQQQKTSRRLIFRNMCWSSL